MARIHQIVPALATLPLAAGLLRRHGRPPAVLYFGESLGDDLLATAVLRQWHDVRGTLPWYLTRHPRLFEGNTDVALVHDYSPALAGALQLLGIPRIRLRYHDYDAETDCSAAPPDHIINLMCRRAGLPNVYAPRPWLRLTPEEIAAARRPAPYLVVQSSARSAAMPIGNKEWFPERMQAVATHFAARMEVVQLGSPSDPPLADTTDLRGTTTPREAAAVLTGAEALVGLVGFLMHVARAVETRAVVVFGGREHPTQSGYPENVNLFTPLDCSPCWLWNRCPFDKRCMREISADMVIAATETVLAAPVA